MYKQHCWCHLRDATRGGMVDPELADHMRDGIPLCGNRCAADYDRSAARLAEQREMQRRAIAGHINGHRHGGLART